MVDQYLSQQAVAVIGLPDHGLTGNVATTNLQLYPAADTLSPANRLVRVKLAFLSNVFSCIRLIEGNLPLTL